MKHLQPLSAKLAEINFRKSLVVQHCDGKKTFEFEPDSKMIKEILADRIHSTRKIFQKLAKKGFTLSPFLEIGAEKCQRSVLLTNEFKASGFACDISLESLESAEYYAKLFGYKDMPYRICCDAYRLPFADNSFPFIFCFETLHHFPHPKPIITEMYRVLAPGGLLYFGEEPVKQFININLWRRGNRLNFPEKLLKYTGILPFISRIGGTETKYGILEEEFSLATWKESLSLFNNVKLEVKPIFFGPSSQIKKTGGIWNPVNPVTQLLTYLEGGGIEGMGIKKGRPVLTQVNKIGFICPDCRSLMKKHNNYLTCPACKRLFSGRNSILMALPANIQNKLYG